ncbi:hypothetical protein ANCDUO_06498 [Ancylostoma duodenale]|uniref:Uncharacterized protein n=1 Tax=Ancylostoma duodenale TaxID=51022 RepID=A0A0C2GPC4_9BILA|nr:hypothetical protein ANCDUO_06498 [Ancylostoma duodenale]
MIHSIQNQWRKNPCVQNCIDACIVITSTSPERGIAPNIALSQLAYAFKTVYYRDDHCKTISSPEFQNELKSRVEALEKELSEIKAASTVSNLQGNNGPGADEVPIEQCCEVLASIETQTSRLCKQVEKIDQAQKDERRRSLSKDSSATIIAELANLLNELKNVHTIMDTIKPGSSSLARKSPLRENAPPLAAECAKCAENQKVIDEQQNEVVFYKKKNKDLTNQILQTEDRWTIEIEKQRQIFENEKWCPDLLNQR